MNRWLVDTGPLVAFLNTSDAAHRVVAPVFGAFSGELFTTEAVVTEAMYLLRKVPSGPRRLAEFVVACQIAVHGTSSPADLVVTASLMERYADTPMDYADATLVVLADQIRERRVLTLDRRGFSVFRNRQKEAFELVLDGFTGPAAR